MAYADIDAGKVLNKAGLLELSNQIKSYVDANVGGGSNADIGDVIQLFYAITVSPYNKGYLSRVSTGSELLAGLLDGKICLTAGNWNTYGSDNRIQQTDLSNETVYIWRFANNKSTQADDLRFDANEAVYWDANKNILYRIPFYIWNKVYLDSTGHTLYSYLPSSVPTTGSKVVVLNSGAPSWQDYVSLPTAPTTDGTYMLKCVVSSGTPTYSWEEITVGGSY